jgi:nucleotidyltransferase/DNA polymerase involved in DNA repair
MQQVQTSREKLTRILKSVAILQKHSDDQCRIDHEITADLDLIDKIT